MIEKKSFPLFLFVTALLFSYCNKRSAPNTDQLPDNSSKGENTFACYRNGIPWIAKRGAGMEGNFFGDTLVAKATVSSNNKTEILEIVLRQTNFPAQSVYALTDTVNAYVSYFSNGFTDCFAPLPGYGDIATRKVTNGTVTLTRADGKVIAGFFAFGVVSDRCDTIQFTSGRFDIQVFQ
jgi:hypothetical protein